MSIIYLNINALPDEAICKTKLFADDSKLLSGNDDPKDSLNLQNELYRVCLWSNTWDMKLNVNKCKIMHLGKRIHAGRTLWETSMGIYGNWRRVS